VCDERGVEPVTLAEACLRGGARLLQLRWKGAPGGAFLSLAELIVARARECGAAVIINDRPDIARLASADGVHVGQDDLSVDDVRQVAGADAIVGLSTHDERQVDAALAGSATYVAVGPIFSTTTKPAGAPRGLGLLRYASDRGKPVVAIGGITLDRVRSVIAAGASGVAIVTDLLATGDPETRVRAYLQNFA